MSLISYEDARPWAKSIRAKVVSREMPPWGADPHYGTFKDDRSLSAAQIDTIAAWADGGAPRGRDANLPRLPSFAAGWSHGEPDVVIDMPVEFAIPAEGEVPVIDFFTKTPFTQDVYVKALEVRRRHAGRHPSRRRLRDRQAAGRREARERPDHRRRRQRDVAQPGRARQRRHEHAGDPEAAVVRARAAATRSIRATPGQLIKAGSYIDFYMHYTPNGQPAKDRSRLGLYFAKPDSRSATRSITRSAPPARPRTSSKARSTRRSGAARGSRAACNLPNIPPYAENFKVVSVHTITEPVTLYGLTPHLHLRGKSMKYTLTSPDGTEEVLLDVPKYDFNWQLYYELADAEEDPRRQQGHRRDAVRQLARRTGTTRRQRRKCIWSEQSWDEMYAPQARITVDSRALKTAATVASCSRSRGGRSARPHALLFLPPVLVTVMSLSVWLSTEYSVNGWYISSQLCSDQ